MLDSLARRAQREQRLTAVCSSVSYSMPTALALHLFDRLTISEHIVLADSAYRIMNMQVQDRIRYEFGVRQLQNTVKSSRVGQRTRRPGSQSSVYALCHTGPTLTSSMACSGPHASHTVSPQPSASVPQNCTVGPQTALPSAAWALRTSPQEPQEATPADAGRPCAVGTPKVGLSTWCWGGASATLSAIAGGPAHAPPPSAAAAPSRPQTARPFRIRTRMDAELQADMKQKVCTTSPGRAFHALATLGRPEPRLHDMQPHVGLPPQGVVVWI